MGMKKTLALFLTALLFCLIAAACFADNDDSSLPFVTTEAAQPGNYKTAEEIKNGLTNYEIEITFMTKDSLTENQAKIKELRCKEAAFVQIDNSIYYKDYETDTMYILDEDTKSGFKSRKNESLNDYADIFSSYLANWQTYSSSFKSPKNDELIGRSCKRYDFELMGIKYSYWIDDSTQICLKFCSEYGSQKQTMIVNKLETGNISKKDLPDISDYEIMTIDEFES
jgi:hypothetical protein